MPGTQRGRRPGQPQAKRGDATGRISENMRAEQSDELREAAERTTMLQPIPESYADDIDDVTPEALEAESLGRAVEEEAVPMGPPDESGLLVKALPREQRRSLLVAGVDGGDPDQWITVRINGNYPDVTIGAGNHYNFEQDQRYYVRRWVAQHLEEKDMLSGVG